MKPNKIYRQHAVEMVTKAINKANSKDLFRVTDALIYLAERSDTGERIYKSTRAFDRLYNMGIQTSKDVERLIQMLGRRVSKWMKTILFRILTS